MQHRRDHGAVAAVDVEKLVSLRDDRMGNRIGKRGSAMLGCGRLSGAAVTNTPHVLHTVCVSVRARATLSSCMIDLF